VGSAAVAWLGSLGMARWREVGGSNPSGSSSELN
jgi:hypothetical protein